MPRRERVTNASTRSNLEIFLLALVQAGVRTPYDMMSKAGVSLGSSLPALNRLVKDGLLGVTEGNSRGRKIFRTKGFGSVVLIREWKRQMGVPHEDMESILRTAALVWARRGEEECGKFLYKSGGRLKKKGRDDRFVVREEPPGGRSGLVERYAWLRRSLELQRRNAEIETMFALSRKLWPTAIRGKSRPATQDIDMRKVKT